MSERKKGTRENFDARREINHIQKQIKDYFDIMGAKTVAVIGISGGKDSTIAAKLLVNAIGAERVVGVMMPNGTQPDFDMAEKVIRETDIEHHQNQFIINILETTVAAYNAFHKASKERQTRIKKTNMSGKRPVPIEFNKNISINVPPRMRMAMLYMVAAAIGDARVINTCNASEDYVGYSTKYGDGAGDYAILKDYTVTELYEIGDALGISHDLVHKTPDDGQCGQTDEDRFGFTYEDLDEFIITGVTPNDETMKKIIRMHNANLHKLEPMPKVYRYQ